MRQDIGGRGMNEREIINPHDKIFIDCSDMPAAQKAILLIGAGQYGIEGEDGLPLLVFGGQEEWSQKIYNQSFQEWFDSVPLDRVAEALLSMRLEGERSSLYDLVGRAHKIAKRIKGKVLLK
jgi:hypothetical protein